MQESIVKHTLPKSYFVVLIVNSLLHIKLPQCFAAVFAYLILDAVTKPISSLFIR
jgi:hypothetical protein